MSVRERLGALAIFVMLLVGFTWPLASDPGGLLPEHWDPRVFSWVMGTNTTRLLQDPGALTDGGAFYPYGATTTYSEPLWTPTLTFAPLMWWTDNPIYAYNVTLLLFWALSGVTFLELAVEVAGNRSAAWIGALVFVLCAYRMEYYLEFQMQLVFGLPLALLGWHRVVSRGRARDALLTAAALILTAYASLYYAITAALMLAAFTLAFAAIRGMRLSPGSIRAGAGAAILSAIGSLPLAVAYLRTRAELGFERVLSTQPARHSADLLTYLETRSNLLYSLGTRTSAETALFMGLVATLLAGAACVHAARRPRTRPGLLGALVATALFATVVSMRAAGVELPDPITGVALALIPLAALGGAMVGKRAHADDERAGLRREEWTLVLLVVGSWFFALSLGPVVHLGGVEVGLGLYRPLYEALPFLRAVRVLTRFGVGVMLATSLLASLGTRWLLERVPPRRRLPWVVVLALAVLAETYAGPLQYASQPWPPPGQAYRRLRVLPPGAVLELPIWSTRIDSHAVADATAMLAGLYHEHPVVNGVSGFVPPLTTRIAQRFALEDPGSFPSPPMLTLLRGIYSLRYVVAHPGQLPRSQQGLFARARSGKVPALRPISVGGDAELYELIPAPEQAESISRYVGRDVLRRHPEFQLTTALAAPAPDRLAATLGAWFNDHAIARWPLTATPRHHTLSLPGPWYRAAANRLDLRLRYRVDAGAAELDESYRLGDSVLPLDLEATASGSLAPRPFAHIVLNGQEHLVHSAGIGLAVLDPAHDEVTTLHLFSVGRRGRAARRLRQTVRKLGLGTPALLFTVGGRNMADGRDVNAAIRMLGGTTHLDAHAGAAYLLLGRRGAPPGSAVERIGSARAHLRHGHDPADVQILLRQFTVAPEPTR